MMSQQPGNQQNHRQKTTLTTLPVELLDIVLGHLLDLTSSEYRYVPGPYTGTMRRCGDSVLKTYTSLLRVNRYLAQAAKTCMYTQNSFVILDCDNRCSAFFWNDGYFDNLWNHGYIKCVSASSHLDHNFDHHIARVDICTPGAVKGPRFRLLLLVSQLESFLWRMKYLDFFHPRNNICLRYTPLGDPLQFELMTAGIPITISILMRELDDVRLDTVRTRARSLHLMTIQPFQILGSNGIRVQVEGIDDELRDRICSERYKQIVSADAISRDFLRSINSWENELTNLLDEIDVNANSSDTAPSVKQLLDGYLFLACLARTHLGTAISDPDLRQLTKEQIQQTWQWQLYVTILDLFVTSTSLALYHVKLDPSPTGLIVWRDVSESFGPFVLHMRDQERLYVPARLADAVARSFERQMPDPQPGAGTTPGVTPRSCRYRTDFTTDVRAHYVGWCDTTLSIEDTTREYFDMVLNAMVIKIAVLERIEARHGRGSSPTR